MLHNSQGHLPFVNVLIDTTQADFNLDTHLGNPVAPKRWIVTIQSNVRLYGSTTGNYGFDTGSLPAGSEVRIVNNGEIRGDGGNGGDGGDAGGAGANGGAGGPAMNIELNVEIDNANGEIFGGGGGGGGGGGARADIESPKTTCGTLGGGGGGGGASSGTVNSLGGALGTGQSAAQNGVAGAVGTATRGLGGAGHAESDGDAGDGGNGGTHGNAGAGGGTGVSNDKDCAAGAAGGSGGLAGKAIDLNGNTIMWLSGFDSDHVKGAVS